MVRFGTAALLLSASVGIFVSQYAGPIMFGKETGQIVMPLILAFICSFFAMYAANRVKYYGSVAENALKKTSAKVFFAILAAGMFYFLYSSLSIIVYFLAVIFFIFTKAWLAEVPADRVIAKSFETDKIMELRRLRAAASCIHGLLWLGVFLQLGLLSQISLDDGKLLFVSAATYALWLGWLNKELKIALGFGSRAYVLEAE